MRKENAVAYLKYMPIGCEENHEKSSPSEPEIEVSAFRIRIRSNNVVRTDYIKV
jgi:hypothetical protein